MSKLALNKKDSSKKSLVHILDGLKKSNLKGERTIEILTDLIDYFRPETKNFIRVSINELIDLVSNNEEYRIALRNASHQIVEQKRFTRILTDTGIFHDRNFLGEVKKRVLSKVLPQQPEKDTLEFALNQILYKSSDANWISTIPRKELNTLIELLELQSIYESLKENTPLTEILNALNIIIQRVSGRALEADILQMVPEYEDVQSPFEGFIQELNEIEITIRASEHYYVKSDHPQYVRLQELLVKCLKFVDRAYENSSIYGISVDVNQSLLRIRQQLHRIEVLLPMLAIDKEEDKHQNSLVLAFMLIDFNCQKNNIRQLINDTTGVISYEITKHTAKTGEHYITSDRKEYFSMLKASLGGGVIVGILCIIKVFLSKMEISDFGHAFFYSMNYSLGFIAIYLFGFTLATKQPAMTAAAIVNAIDKGLNSNEDELYRHVAFAELFSRLFRSQFIAFVGNVFAAFPIALLGVYLIDINFDYNASLPKWIKLQDDLSPFHSKLVLHAAIAGVFLFLSGIISGNVSNKLKYNQIPYRIEENPFLKRSLGREKTRKLSVWVANKWPGISSNFWFGVFMGSTASVGAFIGLDLDIRHITFGAGNLGLSLYGSEFQMTADMLVLTIFGIGLIGLINFTVSFFLSLWLAMRSRNLPFSELSNLFSSVWMYFKIEPQSFFFPGKK